MSTAGEGPGLTARDVLAEFVRDVAAAYTETGNLDELEDSWPDLVQTYRRAEQVLERGEEPPPPRDLNKGYASVSWSVADVQTLFDVTDEEAREFLRADENRIRSRIIERGWDVLRSFGMRRDGWPELKEEEF